MSNLPGNTVRSGSAMYTSRMRERQEFHLSSRPQDEIDIDISGLEELLDQTWNIYAVSVLFDFQQDDTHFKLYSKKLREEIAGTLSHEDVTYDAKFSVIKNILCESNEGHPAVKIEVLAKTNSRERNVEKLIYKGILLSWKLMQNETNIPNSVKLPLLLCRGTRSCMNAVHTTISHMFDCSIIALPAKEEDLSWLVPIIIMSTNKEGQPAISGEVQMEYTVPESSVTDTITVKFHISDLRKMLSVIITDQDDEINISHEHIEVFYEVLHKQMLTLGGLQLGLCTLHRINLPGITIIENKIKVKNEDIMHIILLYLYENAFDTFPTLHINI